MYPVLLYLLPSLSIAPQPTYSAVHQEPRPLTLLSTTSTVGLLDIYSTFHSRIQISTFRLYVNISNLTLLPQLTSSTLPSSQIPPFPSVHIPQSSRSSHPALFPQLKTYPFLQLTSTTFPSAQIPPFPSAHIQNSSLALKSHPLPQLKPSNLSSPFPSTHIQHSSLGSSPTLSLTHPSLFPQLKYNPFPLLTSSTLP
jgi:hypothetical protein